MRRTKATPIYKQTKNLRAVQLLLGHTKLESTVRYLGIEVDDAPEISEPKSSEPLAAACQSMWPLSGSIGYAYYRPQPVIEDAS